MSITTTKTSRASRQNKEETKVNGIDAGKMQLAIGLFLCVNIITIRKEKENFRENVS
jgi:hypothetical protein